MKKSSFAAALVACVLAGMAAPSIAQQTEPMFPKSKDGLLLDELGIKAIKMNSAVHDGEGKSVGNVPDHAAVLQWVDQALKGAGYRLPGNESDPSVQIEVECYSKRCSTEVWLVRDVYVRRAEDGRQFFLRLPNIPVAEFHSEYTSQLADEESAQREAVYGTVRSALRKLTMAVIEANGPEALAKQERLFSQPVATPEVKLPAKPSKKAAKR